MMHSEKSLGMVSLPLAPGFSPVLIGPRATKPFQRLFKPRKAAEAAGLFCCRRITGLKPGANESCQLNPGDYLREICR
jgi:hypothetical protein